MLLHSGLHTAATEPRLGEAYGPKPRGSHMSQVGPDATKHLKKKTEKTKTVFNVELLTFASRVRDKLVLVLAWL